MIEYLTEKEVAKRFKISPRTLQRWRWSGSVALPYVLIGRTVRYRITDIEIFERDNRHFFKEAA